MTRRSLVLAAAAAALIALPAAWYVESPWWTLWRMRDAARAGDAARLASYVDFDAVRARAEAGVRADLSSVLEAVGAHGTGRLADFAARTLSDPAVDALVRPETLRPWLAGMSVRFGGLGGGSGGSGYRPAIARRGLSEFVVRDARDPARGGTLTFRRHGLAWKLAAVRWEQP